MDKGTNDGATLIYAERQRQINEEGWTPEHDDELLPGSLAAAGRSYALYAWWQLCPHAGWTLTQVTDAVLERDWPFDERWWKPSEDPVRNLVKAGALIAAEIDKYNRTKQ